jgi:hypothetical protein
MPRAKLIAVAVPLEKAKLSTTMKPPVSASPSVTK